MNAMNQTVARSTGFTRKNLFLMLGGALLGGAVGAGLMELLKRTGLTIKTITWFDLVGLTIGAFYVALGIGYFFLSSNRRRLAAALENADGLALADETGEEKLPATDSEVRTTRIQGAVLGLAGLLMLAPIFATVPVRTHPGLAGWVYAATFVLFLVQTALNLRLWFTSDEFVRKAILAVCAGTFAVTQGLLFLWAAAERLNQVPAASSWDLFIVMMACYLGASAVVSIRMRLGFRS
jgi:hypothetical protein